MLQKLHLDFLHTSHGIWPKNVIRPPDPNAAKARHGIGPLFFVDAYPIADADSATVPYWVSLVVARSCLLLLVGASRCSIVGCRRSVVARRCSSLVAERGAE